MPTRTPKYKREPEAVAKRQITDRTLEILATIEKYRFLPSSLITRLAPGHSRRIYLHLQNLYHKALVNRFSFPRYGYPGEFIYYLDNPLALDQLAEWGIEEAALDRETVQNNREKAYHLINNLAYQEELQGRLLFLKHELMITRFHATLERACRASAGQAELVDWQQGAKLWDTVETPTFAFEQQPNGELQYIEYDTTERLPFRPDALFTLRFADRPVEDNTSTFAYEADRKTTSAPRMIKKFRAQLHYIVKQKKHLDKFKIKRIRAILVETLDPQWATHLYHAAQDKAVSTNPSGLFWFTHSKMLTEPVMTDGQPRPQPMHLVDPTVIFKPIWIPANENRAYTLKD